MKLTYEMKVVLQNLFNQLPCEIDDSNETRSHVRFIFSRDLDADIFRQSFNNLNRSMFILNGNVLTIMKEGIGTFIGNTKHLFAKIEMELNHKKYLFVFAQLKQSVQKIEQLSPNTAIIITSKDNINAAQFNVRFLMDKNDYYIFENELTIFPSGINDFNSAINQLHAEFVSALFLKNEATQDNSFRLFS